MIVIVLFLISGGIFFTLRFGFLNIRGFSQAIAISLSKHNTDNSGDVSPFQALTTALSATVGLGNIAGVAIAIQVGGVGSVFWMSVGAFLGMSSKFVECSLGQQFRLINPDGTISGGPMYFLETGLSKIELAKLGKILAVIYAVLCVGASFGAGNMFQVNQSFAALEALFPSISSYNWLFGLAIMFLVGLVIVGGITRIGSVTSKLVPLMIGLYLLGCFWVVAVKITEVPTALQTIMSQAFEPISVEGGFIGLLVTSMRRSIFSHGAGLGTAAIAHAAAKNNEPIREGLVSMLEPFIDTIIICNLTALVIVLTGTYGAQIPPGIDGSKLTALAFAQVISWFPYVLAIIILLFGFSTIIAWSYYGEKAWFYLFQDSNLFIYKGLFLFFVFFGAIANLNLVVDFSDFTLLALSIPNIIGCILLSGIVARELKSFRD
ncbi:amino acid carrier protein [Xenococcus sp. PCC 7305]|uniref:alanine/glycine:cation symporter family protein n=1 Tax=Xenococcus sp. PCC 7305 TaxID=102125 RepID=UPI0002ABF758|nr:alanine/glycine:cation symporter family protein [Xenococcus sp. PCC 7305]ELS03917.1 amino acid carrier protein [Xenococcus sp. PCC 7305]